MTSGISAHVLGRLNYTGRSNYSWWPYNYICTTDLFKILSLNSVMMNDLPKFTEDLWVRNNDNHTWKLILDVPTLTFGLNNPNTYTKNCCASREKYLDKGSWVQYILHDFQADKCATLCDMNLKSTSKVISTDLNRKKEKLSTWKE